MPRVDRGEAHSNIPGMVAMSTESYESLAESLPPIVLLVDGDPDALQTHSQYLEAAGLWVATASDPRDAVSHVRELRPNLVVTDMMFAGESTGADLVRAVKKDTRTSHIPVMLLSNTPVDHLPSETPDVDLVLVKPVVPSVLYQRGRALIAASATLRERSNAALDRAQELMNQNLATRQRNRVFVEKLQNRPRECPTCGSPLDWLERGSIGGVEYDYYRWCLQGCGLYCFDRRSKHWVKLAG
jgi:CheY-like chemotaxis protein